MKAERIEPRQVLELMRQGERVVMVDSRLHSWIKSEVQAEGAVRVPLDEVEQHLDRLPRDAAIVTYCTCPNEKTSLRVAENLRDYGFKAFALAGGFKRWEDEGMPVEPKMGGNTIAPAY